MNVFKLFNFSSEKSLAETLAKQLSEDIPVNLMAGQGKPLTVNRVTTLLERAYKTAINYQVVNNLGFIGRTVLVNDFKWRLRGMEYSDKFIDMAAEGLIVALSKRKI